MKQLLQSMRSGAITVRDVDAPETPRRSGVIVRNYASLISAGTEKMSVELARASLLEKAKSRPDDVKKVIAEIKQQGFWKTYNRIMNKLETPKAMGYSCAGEVIAVSEDVTDLKPGDRVACGGQGANHAEVVSVLKNLCVKIPDTVSFEDACYTTLGSIAMQGVRQAEVRFGEYVAVIGLGLVGQLTCAIAKAAGCVVIGIDLDDENVLLANSHNASFAFNRKAENLPETIKSLTHGFGIDSIIITAATHSNDPIEFSAQIARDRAKVVMVGVTKMDIPRDPFYLKELDFRFSRSYGPGRYERDYEEKGIDYPIGYVRWTERRNMQEFVRLLSEKKVDPSKITTHTLPIDQAQHAYDMIAGEHKERYLGIVLTYPESPKSESRILRSEILTSQVRQSARDPRIGFIGAGNFAQGFLLPTLKENAELVLVANESGSSSEDAKTKFGFKHSTTNPDEVISSSEVNTIFIATRHNLHAALIIKALEAGKNVFCEKPLTLNFEEASRVAQAYSQSSGGEPKLLVGFNRRFSPLVKKMKDFFGEPNAPKLIFYRVNAGPVKASDWTQDEEIGGGRIIGEVCHFIDTAAFLTGDSLPRSVVAKSLSSGRSDVIDQDNISITIEYDDGSVATILYIANGDKNLPKEELQVFSSGRTAIMKNFTELELWSGSGKPQLTSGQGKGHKEEIEAFTNAIKSGGPAPIPFDSILATTLVTFAIRESLSTGEVVRF
ncbi:MAG: bi-domain-containing oxidoreductase [Bacteroidota bacterium]|nr:bi-domain-containing oxidoreductase [Bacteroidota bacterium]MDP4228846.1 bi-domain-containing oxidoreductase [Bacteroidota bacterium]MDP4235798.1 bi-domain-containing oxidoreductase [Bacteroidota bacterium]